METALTSKTLVTLYQTTSRHNLDDGNFQVLKKVDMSVATTVVWLRRETSEGIL
jgi:hypothetical protein